MKRAQIHPEIQARVPQIFIMKCLSLLKDQEKKLSQKFCRVYGVEESSISTEDEDRDRLMSKTRLIVGLPAKQHRLNQSTNAFLQEQPLSTYPNSGFGQPYHSTAKTPGNSHSMRDKSTVLEEDQTSSSTLLIDRRLKDIEANFKLATSIYDDIADLRNSQSPYLDRIQQSLDQALKKTTLVEIETGENFSQVQKSNKGIWWKVMLVLLATGVVGALLSRGVRV